MPGYNSYINRDSLNFNRPKKPGTEILYMNMFPALVDDSIEIPGNPTPRGYVETKGVMVLDDKSVKRQVVVDVIEVMKEAIKKWWKKNKYWVIMGGIIIFSISVAMLLNKVL